MPYGTLLTDTIKSSTSGPVAFQNTSGTEVGTLCRAWVNFNGTGTVAIRGSFNVSSITDRGTGEYTVNFTNAMPDTNYAVAATARVVGDAGCVVPLPDTAVTTTTFALSSRPTPQGASTDAAYVYVAFFR